VRNQLVSPLPISQDLFVSCSANTSKQHFSDRSKLMSMLLAPHLINAIRNAFAYERVNSALETKDCGIIAINSNGKPLFISEFAAQLLDKYFAGEKRESSSLPENLDNWLSQTNLTDFSIPVQPFKIENKKGELIVRLMYNNKTGEKTLLLEEKRSVDRKGLEQLSITEREAEILFWITQGKSDNVIALLCGISSRTVQKHIENIYTKLGVESRTEAMLKALEVL
jgi:DNA-binding CsgD family transcriptional regulator